MDDELTSINAIYGDGTLVIPSSSDQTGVLKLPGIDISLRMTFPETYPDTPPTIVSPESVGSHLPKGTGQRVVDIARSILNNSFQCGEPCIFDLIEQLNAEVDDLGLDNPTQTPREDVVVDQTASNGETDRVLLPGEAPPWTVSEVAQEKKSIFIARAAHVTHPDEAKRYVQHLLSTDKKAAKATHNITAWRMKQDSGVVYQDCDDDDETAAGGRLLHLLQVMDVWNVMVVVTRWYGGVHLGPDRFRIISSVARDAIVKGGFVKNAGS